MSRCPDCGSNWCEDWCGADPYDIWQDKEEAEEKIAELEQRIDKAVKMVHNIRRYSEVYTPIKEGCEDVLRVLKGRDND